MRSQWTDLSVSCHEFNFQLNSATLKVLSFPSNKVNAKMASIALKIFIRASTIVLFCSPIFIYEFKVARWSNFKRSTVIFSCINHSLIANAIWVSGTKQGICFQVLLSLSHCDHSLCSLSFSIPCLHHRQEAECAKKEWWFVPVLWNLVLLLLCGPNTEGTVHAQLLQHKLFETLCQLSLWNLNKTELLEH